MNDQLSCYPHLRSRSSRKMVEEPSYLAANMRFLRKQRKLSQRKLAAALGIKRSNIAAYETKNVEPRLSLINRIAEFFQVGLAELITRDLASDHAADQIQVVAPLTGRQATLNDQAVSRLEVRMQEMRKMLDGFRVFYQHRLDNMQQPVQAGANGSSNDVENFLIFIDQVITYNEQIFDFLHQNGLSRDTPVEIPEKRAS